MGNTQFRQDHILNNSTKETRLYPFLDDDEIHERYKEYKFPRVSGMCCEISRMCTEVFYGDLRKTNGDRERMHELAQEYNRRREQANQLFWKQIRDIDNGMPALSQRQYMQYWQEEQAVYLKK